LGPFRAVVAHPVARLLLASQGASSLGDWVGLAALLVLAYERTNLVTGSASLLAVTGVAAMLTPVLFGPFLDRVDRRRALAVVYLLGGASVGLVLLFDGVWPIFVAALALGMTRPAAGALRHAITGTDVPDELITPSVTLQGSVGQATATLGMLLGGTAVVTLGATVAIVFDILTFVVAAAVVLRLEVSPPLATASPPRWNDGFATWLWPGRPRRLMQLLLVAAAIGSLPEALAPAAAEGSAWFPLVLAGQAGGTAIGSLLFGRAPRWASMRGLRVLAVGCGVALLGGAVVVGMSPALLAGANFLFGIAYGLTSLAQGEFTRSVDRDRVGAAVASGITATMIADGLGALAFGIVADTMGPATSYSIAAGVIVAAAVFGWLVGDDHEEEAGQHPVPADVAASQVTA
jgi:predicted MFS family arabinose efflux permease